MFLELSLILLAKLVVYRVHKCMRFKHTFWCKMFATVLDLIIRDMQGNLLYKKAGLFYRLLSGVFQD